MSRTVRILRPLALVTLIAAGLIAGAALLAEHSGWLTRKVRAALVERLGEPLELQHVGLSWLDPSVRLHGLSLGAGGPRLDSVRARVAFVGWRPIVSRLEVRGGRVAVDDALLLRLRSPEAAEPAGELRLPEIVIEQVDLALVHPRWGAVPIGRVDAVWSLREDGMPSIQGRVVPPLARDGSAGELYLQGRLEEPGVLVLRASCEDLALSADALPEEELSFLRALEPHGRLALRGSARISLDGKSPSSGSLRGSLSGGTILPPTTPRPVEDVELDFDCRLDPAAGAGLADPTSWSATLHAQGRWKDAQMEGWGFFGRAAGGGRVAAAWARAKDVPLEPELLEAFGGARILHQVWSAVEPRGACDATLALEVTPWNGLEAALEFDLAGKVGGSYVGFTRPDGSLEGGFPLPVEGLSGKVLVLVAPERDPIARVALVDLQGTHAAGGPARVSALIESSPPGAGEAHPTLDLWLESAGIPADERVERALAGLPGTDWIWPAFSPGAGTLAGKGRIVRERATGGLAAGFTVHMEDAEVVWSELPAPISGIDGQLELVFDPSGGWGAAYQLTGRSLGSDSLTARGRVQTERGAFEHGPLIEDHEGKVQNLGLRGADRDALVARFPGIGVGLQPIAPSGKVDGSLRLSRPLGDGLHYQIEVAPRQVRFSPQAFQVETRNVRGRVIVSGSSGGGEERVITRIAPLLGEWAGDMQVAGTAVFDSDAEARVHLFGAGLVPGNPNVAGALRAALGAGGGDSGVDLSALRVEGRVDISGQLILAAAPETPPEALYRVHLRGNDLEARRSDEARFGLQALEGVLVQEGDVLRGERLAARLGRTQVLLRQPTFRRQEGAWTFESLVEAQGLPLDREHLGFFLDPATVNALLEDLHLSGEVDIDGARLELSGAADGGQRVDFSGDLRPRAMRIDIGLPLEIDQARVRVESLVFEGRHVRAWARVEDLDGRIAGRTLGEAALQLTYVEPHLSVLALDGELEGGRMSHLRGSPAFSIDLAPPFLFDLALRLEGVQVGGLLRGLFESEFASRGSVGGELRLSGSLDHLSGIRGEGSLDLADTTLWSIPVMRNLFSQLGLDETAVFERMRTRLAVQDGVIHMSGIHVYSPLLQLVGAGTLDLDGRLHHDLQVRYSLVDKLGPLTRLLYWVQNNLLSVAVRGDMQRPRVELKGMLSFLQRARASGRDLPLPGLAPLPPRF